MTMNETYRSAMNSLHLLCRDLLPGQVDLRIIDQLSRNQVADLMLRLLLEFRLDCALATFLWERPLDDKGREIKVPS